MSHLLAQYPGLTLADGELAIIVLIAALPWLVCVAIAANVGEERGRGGFSIVMAIFFGPLGVVIACLLPRPASNQAVYKLAVERERLRIIEDQRRQGVEEERKRREQDEAAEAEARRREAEVKQRAAEAAKPKRMIVTCPVCGRDNPIRVRDPQQSDKRLKCSQCGELLSVKKAAPA